MNYRLSKSKVIEYLQCPKRLYLSIHHPELKEESSDLQARFDVGHQVGELARQLFPDGIMIGDEINNDLRAALEQTKQVLRDYPSRPIFEATFQHGGMLIRADLLIPYEASYRMVEVKSSTSVKDYHLPDCAMQSWVTENAGIPLSRVSLMHVDNSFVYEQMGNYQGLLKETDITEAIQPFKQNVPIWIEDAQHLLAGSIPEIEIGPQCSSPFECPYYGHCSTGQPEYPVIMLPGNMGRRGTADMLKARGYQDLTLVPVGVIDSPPLERIRRITASRVAELDESVRKVMAALPYPRYYLDFETIQFAVPVWMATRPFQQLPFQWSCHIESADGSLDHIEFLDLSGNPPMREFAESLIKAVGDDGPILVYNQGFEKTRIREMAEMFPDFADSLAAINDRIVDLHPIAKQYYYHPDMKGSWSIKAVLPTIAPDLDYSDLEEVQDGGMAQTAYLEAIAPATTSERRELLRKALLKYCQRDTMAMVVLAQFFAGKERNP